MNTRRIISASSFALLLVGGLSGCEYKSKASQPGVEVSEAPSERNPGVQSWEATNDGAADIRVSGIEAVTPGQAGKQTLSFRSGGLQRSLNLYIPANRQEKPGVLVLFHGLGDSGANFAASMGAAELAEKYGVVVAVPEGTPNSEGGMKSWNAGPGCCAFGDDDRDDSKLLGDIIASTERVLPIDRERVDIAGFSNGGYFVEYNVCKNADLIRGALNVAGSDPLPNEECSPSKPVSLIRIHGEADDRVPFAGGEIRGRRVVSFNESFVNWRTRMKCSTAPRNEYWGQSICRVQDACMNGTYISCQLPGLGHSWPNPDSTSLDVFERAWQVWQPTVEP